MTLDEYIQEIKSLGYMKASKSISDSAYDDGLKSVYYAIKADALKKYIEKVKEFDPDDTTPRRLY